MLGVTHNDQIGKIGEMQFDIDCTKRDLFCSWPTIDRNGYDCIVDNGTRLIKVQIKSSNSKQIKSEGNPFYKISVRKGLKGRDSYTKDCFDVLAMYLIPEDKWYIMPFEDIYNTCISIYINSEKSKYKKYENNWDLLNL